jgi:hypothetical protein
MAGIMCVVPGFPSGLSLVVLMLVFLQRLILKRKGKYRVQRRHPCFVRDIIQRLTPKEFHQRYRMSPKSFLLLTSKLYSHLRLGRRLKSINRNTIRWMTPEVKVAVTLRYLAGGQVYDIADYFGFHPTSVNRAINETMRAILKSSIGKHTFKAKNRTWLAGKARLYQGLRVTNPLAEKCVACVDGIAIKIQRPDERYGPKDYQNRKGFFAMVCQGICDAEHRFLVFDCASPGRTHDSLALTRTQVFEALSEGLPDSHWIAGDAAYPLIGSIMKPFARCQQDVWKDSYNFHLSSLRISIENSFGIFVQRWGIFWRTLRCSPSKASRVIMCCVRLHNFCIDTDGSERCQLLLKRGQEHRFLTNFQDELALDNLEAPSQTNSRGYGKSMRASHVELLSRLGIVRPPTI